MRMSTDYEVKMKKKEVIYSGQRLKLAVVKGLYLEVLTIKCSILYF